MIRFNKLTPKTVVCLIVLTYTLLPVMTFINMLSIELASLGMLSLTDDEFNYTCKEIRFIPQCYWEWLKSFKFDFNKIFLLF